MIKHSKFKNTGLIFELLVRTVTTDALAGKPSKAVDILQEYFSKGELAKEYKLYEIILNANLASDAKADLVLNTVLESSQKLNKTILKKKKYNLIAEIKKYYDIDTFFQYRVPNYKTLASLCVLFEIQDSNANEPSQIISNKTTILEHITKKQQTPTLSIVDEYNALDKDIQILTYRKLLENFNSKYSGLDAKQKEILKEYISMDSSTDEFKDVINGHILTIKKQLKQQLPLISDPTVRIKVTEISNNIKPLDKVKDDDIAKVLQYFELLKEIKSSK